MPGSVGGSWSAWPRRYRCGGARASRRDHPGGRPRASLTVRSAMSPEPPVYRPFALLGLAATLAAGIPLGVWLLAWLYLGVAAVPAEWILLHAHLQIFGFFGTLIMGVSQHLLPRFTGRPVSRSPFMLWLLGLQVSRPGAPDRRHRHASARAGPGGVPAPGDGLPALCLLGVANARPAPAALPEVASDREHRLARGRRAGSRPGFAGTRSRRGSRCRPSRGSAWFI